MKFICFNFRNFFEIMLAKNALICFIWKFWLFFLSLGQKKKKKSLMASLTRNLLNSIISLVSNSITKFELQQLITLKLLQTVSRSTSAL